MPEETIIADHLAFYALIFVVVAGVFFTALNLGWLPPFADAGWWGVAFWALVALVAGYSLWRSYR